MARSVIQLEGDEIKFFHANYYYMWKKLNTAPYYVSGTGETPDWIHDQWLLPSYVNLSKCMNPEFVPSVNIVNKIVQFYNANIKPEVDTYSFLHEKLDQSDNIRSTKSYEATDDYCGLYRGYYYAGIADKKVVYGAAIRISKAHDVTVVQMITGITTDRDFENMQLKELMNSKDIALDKYKTYRDSLELSKRRTSLYKGGLELAPGVLSMEMHSEDHEGSVVVFRCAAVPSMDNQFFGSLGVMSLLAKGGIQIVKMGIVRADRKDLKPFSLEDENVKKILEIEKQENEHVVLAFQDNAKWNDMIISSN